MSSRNLLGTQNLGTGTHDIHYYNNNNLKIKKR